ncbi:MAG: shikimate dehydrogenase [Pseudomonadaceae bacterium]|nr:shikimate dehydrogenase [Pseudomonadaceae bacterium]
MSVDRYAVIGNPIEHSLSPRIHRAFAAQLGHEIEYSRLRADDDDFERVADQFFRSGGAGMNVTVPFKTAAFDWVDERGPGATMAGAVNTIAWDNGKLRGHNTDGVGLVADLTQNLGFTLTNARVLVIGAGGATRGLLAPFLNARVGKLVIANRTSGNAEALASLASDDRVTGCGLDLMVDGESLAGSGFDLVIHASAAVRRGSLPAVSPAALRSAFCYDLDYATGMEQTAFVRFAGQCNARAAHDGLGMLIEQAAAAYAIWRGVRPETAGVRQLLDSELGRRGSRTDQ